jgi:Family of unknown function (DUF5372)
MSWTASSTTPVSDDRYRQVRVTHPFHRLYGRDFEFVAHRQNWGEDRVHLHDEKSSGLEGLVPARPGPRGGHKLTEQILAWAEQRLAAGPGLRPAQLADPIEQAFGVRAPPVG